MYRYDEFDHAFVRERVAQFRDQVERRLAGELTEDEFRPLRLRNGLYLQLHAYMLRIAIPYGVLSPRQLRQLAMIGRQATIAATAISPRGRTSSSTGRSCRTSRTFCDASPRSRCTASRRRGNCVRNVTADPFGGRRRRRARGPAPDASCCANGRPPSRILLAAAQIQDRGLGRGRRTARPSLHDIGLRIVRCGRRARLSSSGRRRPGPHADDRHKVIGDFVPAADLISLCRGHHAGLQR